MKYSIALSTRIHEQAVRHLVREDGQEDLCFALWYPSSGNTRYTGIINKLIIPREGERNVHWNVSFNSCYLERVQKEATRANAGIALLHSHPSSGWQDMSDDDILAEERTAPSCFGATGLPFIGMTVGDDGAWSGRFWKREAQRVYQRKWCESVRVVGHSLDVTFNDELLPVPNIREELLRTVSAWGSDAQAKTARLTVGVVGLGSVGSIVAESLARIGVSTVLHLDFDAIERVNLDRVLHSSGVDIEKSKVEVISKATSKSATSSSYTVLPVEYSICEEHGYRAALDCDILFSCVDRPWPRFVLNQIAYAHFIPVIDGGIYIETNKLNTQMKRGNWRSHVVGPGKKCLECIGQYTPEAVALEMSGDFDKLSYIANLPSDHFLHNNQNIFPFSLSLAAFEMQHFIMMVVSPAGVSDVGSLNYHFVSATLEREGGSCKQSCITDSYIGQGDLAFKPYVDVHPVAEEARSRRKSNNNLDESLETSPKGKLSRIVAYIRKLIR
ncbi:ThiF family adenylyltransferase [Pontibacter sp. Tf4]|uniref:ThiF family adenylyltransferase n=1 Tax=Pontibacter sp. Tf4 TaxID=2761620 RepID=UPI0016285ED9|nr:ThiF family adenylyltransferase [Pontibacter sp. Tf4]MBB6611785.1 ThiF family adenylyltransferase [Pontibacter sp. Tf4]